MVSHTSRHKVPVPITTHERVLLALYRGLSVTGRAHLDSTLWRSWRFEGTEPMTAAEQRRRDQVLVDLAGRLTPGEVYAFPDASSPTRDRGRARPRLAVAG